MKIAFFIGSMRRGGAERVMSILANSFSSKGWDVDIILLLDNTVEYPLDKAICIIPMAGESKNYFKNALFWVKNIRNYLKRNRPDQVVSFIGRINALVLTASMGLKIPVIVSERNDPKHDGRGKYMQWYCNAIYHRAKAVVFQNRYEQACFSKSLSGISYIIPNPVSVTATRDWKCHSKTIATAGRLTEQKNQAMLIAAMSTVYKTEPEVRCEIYGEGALHQSLQEQINSLGLSSVVELKGNIADIHERLAACGVFVMTSNYEGLSNSLIEAMMIGLPCITTDYPGADELIRNEENGLVVSCNDEAALAKAIQRILTDEQGEATRLARQSYIDAGAFSAEIVLEKWYSVINGITCK